jgi:predicted ArsR family transcriptional regulator
VRPHLCGSQVQFVEDYPPRNAMWFYEATRYFKTSCEGAELSDTMQYDAAALLASPVRRTLYQALRDAPGPAPAMTAADLAPAVGLHVTTVRFHLDQLVAAGLLDAEFRRQQGAGRPRKVYSVRPGATSRPPSGDPLRLLTALLADALSASAGGEPITPVEAGRRWAREHIEGHADAAPAGTTGAWLGKVGQMIDVLEEWGYQPTITTEEGGRTARVELTDCPFLDLARANTAVVCGVHQGLIAEGMRQFGEPDAEVDLEPFVQSNRCLAHIRRAAATAPARRTNAHPTPDPLTPDHSTTEETTS